MEGTFAQLPPYGRCLVRDHGSYDPKGDLRKAALRFLAFLCFFCVPPPLLGGSKFRIAICDVSANLAETLLSTMFSSVCEHIAIYRKSANFGGQNGRLSRV